MTTDMKTLREALMAMHRRACGDTSAVYMSVPPRAQDADVLLDRALDELEALRARVGRAEVMSTFLTLEDAAMRSQRDELLAALEKANEFLAENAPRDGLGMVDPAANRERGAIVAQADTAIANARGGK